MKVALAAALGAAVGAIVGLWAVIQILLKRAPAEEVCGICEGRCRYPNGAIIYN